MNHKIITAGFTAGLLLGLASSGFADTIVTFQVDMSVAVTNGTYTPGPQTVAVRGSFNGWSGPLGLTNNPAGANPNLYSQTMDVTAIANGAVMDYKFTVEDAGQLYETTLDNNNRCALMPSTSGASLVLPVAYFSDTPPVPPGPATNVVTFRVNMAQQINIGNFTVGTSTGYCRGSFNGFDMSFPLTNDPSIHTTNQFGVVRSNVYVGTLSILGPPASQVEFKYFIDTGANWENPLLGDPDNSGNRFQKLTGSAQVLPIVDFNDQPFAPSYTNNVTFQVDMTVQVGNGNFNPGAGDFMETRGAFNNWNGGFTLTNNPSSGNPNLYSGTYPVIAGIGTIQTIDYKFWCSSPTIGNSGYELPASTGGNNRNFVLSTNSSQVLPAVFWNDAGPNSTLSQNTVVTFSVSMTNAVGFGDGYNFNPAIDSVYINGVTSADSSGFWTWVPSASVGPGFGPAEFLMVNNPPGSEVYSVQVTVPAGTAFGVTYKYGINGADDEAGFAVNHVRYIRTSGSYVMPLDTFGNQFHEIPFGNLAIAKPVAGACLVSWLGLPNVHLQTSTSLIAGWQDHPETAGLSSTNWPVGSGSLFFRLIQPGN